MYLGKGAREGHVLPAQTASSFLYSRMEGRQLREQRTEREPPFLPQGQESLPRPFSTGKETGCKEGRTVPRGRREKVVRSRKPAVG